MSKNKFSSLVDGRLSRLTVSSELHSRLLASARKGENEPMKKKPTFVLALAAVLVLGTLTAFALTRGFGMFDILSDGVNPAMTAMKTGGEQMMKTNLATHSFKHCDVTISEALYDGRYLRITYTVRDRSIKTPLYDTPTNVDMINGFTQDYPEDFPDAPPKKPEYAQAQKTFLEHVRQDGIWWTTTDWCVVNGQDINPLGPTAVFTTENPGETMTYVQFNMREAEPADEYKVLVPILGRDTPEDMTFTIPGKNLEGIRKLPLPEPKKVGNYEIRIDDFTLTPIAVYVKATLTIDAGVDIKECLRISNSWFVDSKLTDEKGQTPLKWYDGSGGLIKNYQFDVKEINGQPEGIDTIIDPTKPVEAVIDIEYLPMDAYPDVFRLGISETEFILISNRDN